MKSLRTTASHSRGAQGICPDGWHIPTWKEYYDLVGKSNAVDGIDGSNVSNTDALFYDSEYDGAKIADLNEAGWNYIFPGYRQKTNFSAAGSYSKLVIDDSYAALTNTWVKTGCHTP